jgi:hypothetical protein
MCDGSRQGDGLHLNTLAFTPEEHAFMVECLNLRFNINCTLHNHNSGLRIYISKSDLLRISHLLLPHIIPEMWYKLGLN